MRCKDGRRDLKGLGGKGVDFKNCSCQRGVQFSFAIIFGGKRVKFWYTTPFCVIIIIYKN